MKKTLICINYILYLIPKTSQISKGKPINQFNLIISPNTLIKLNIISFAKIYIKGLNVFDLIKYILILMY